MAYSTGLIANSSTAALPATQIVVTCINDSPNIPANIEIEVFKWASSVAARTPIGHDLFQLPAQGIRTLTYQLLTGGAFFEVQSDYYSATSTVINVYGTDAAGTVVQDILQEEMRWVDRFTDIP